MYLLFSVVLCFALVRSGYVYVVCSMSAMYATYAWYEKESEWRVAIPMSGMCRGEARLHIAGHVLVASFREQRAMLAHQCSPLLQINKITNWKPTVWNCLTKSRIGSGAPEAQI